MEIGGAPSVHTPPAVEYDEPLELDPPMFGQGDEPCGAARGDVPGVVVVAVGVVEVVVVFDPPPAARATPPVAPSATAATAAK